MYACLDVHIFGFTVELHKKKNPIQKNALWLTTKIPPVILALKPGHP